MKEYWNKPEATAEAFAGGWFHSGDLVRQDEDGYFYVVDRKKDMIISGGENIYCAEVENVLAAHPKVAEVALIGVPDARCGEAPLAVVVAARPRRPADARRSSRRGAASSSPATRARGSLAVVDALPRNPSGKVLKTGAAGAGRGAGGRADVVARGGRFPPREKAADGSGADGTPERSTWRGRAGSRAGRVPAASPGRRIPTSPSRSPDSATSVRQAGSVESLPTRARATRSSRSR